MGKLAEAKMSRIKYELSDVNLFNTSDWEKMTTFLITFLPRFEKAFKPATNRLK